MNAPDPTTLDEPAVAAIELLSIARGMRTADVMAKRAPVRILEAATICPGKFLVVVAGMTDPAREAYEAGLAFAGESVVDRLLLPNAHPQLMPAIAAASDLHEVDALGVVETFSATAGIVAADAACKKADVRLIELRLARGMAGKSFFTLTGTLAEVEASVAAAVDILQAESGLLLWSEVIARPHADLVAKIL